MTTTTTEPVSPEEGTEVPEPAYVVEQPAEAVGPAMIQHEGEAAPHPVELADTGAGTDVLAVLGLLVATVGWVLVGVAGLDRHRRRGITSQ